MNIRKLLASGAAALALTSVAGSGVAIAANKAQPKNATKTTKTTSKNNQTSNNGGGTTTTSVRPTTTTLANSPTTTAKPTTGGTSSGPTTTVPRTADPNALSAGPATPVRAPAPFAG